MLEKLNRDISLTSPIYKSVLILMMDKDTQLKVFKYIQSSSPLCVSEEIKIIQLTAPLSSITVNGGMRMNSWYDIKSFYNSFICSRGRK